MTLVHSKLGRTVLECAEDYRLCEPETVERLGTVVVAAPHPDDESLGCGGLLALLAERKRKPHVIFVTDGSKSHPNSREYPAERLAALRESEAIEALRELGLERESATFLRLPDCGMPMFGTLAFPQSSERVATCLANLNVDTLIVPWRRDPHCDHEVTWSLFRDAHARLKRPPRWVEYPVWAWEHTSEACAPRCDEVLAWRLDISNVLRKKLRAVEKHRSQLGLVVTDDPSGFRLEPNVLRHFQKKWELYFEPDHGDA